MIEVKRHGQDSWDQCIVHRGGSLDYNIHTYIATGDTNQRRGHFIHSIKFYDNEVEMEAERQDAEEELRPQTVEARDLLHLGNYDAYLLNDLSQARADYNDQLIKYNSKFA